MLKFLSVSISGFLNVGENPLEVRLDEPGLNLVVGDNGAGKSARYTESLVWCLFGKTIREVASDGVVNRECSKASVSLSILDAESGDQIMVVREKPRRKSQTLEVYRLVDEDGEVAIPKALFPASNVAERQEALEKWLGLDYHTFVNSVVFGQGAAALFASGGINDADRKRIFDQIAGLDEYDKAAAEAHDRRRDAELKEGQQHVTLMNARGRVETLQGEVSQAADRVNRLSSDLDDHQQSLSVEVEKVEEDLSEARTELEKSQDALVEAEEALAAHQDETSADLAASRDEATSLKGELEAQNRSLMADQARTKARLDSALKEAEKLQGALETATCPYCGSPLQDSDQVEADLAKAVAVAEESQTVIQENDVTLEVLVANLEETLQVVMDCNTTLATSKVRRDQLTSRVSSMKSTVRAMTTAVESKATALGSLGSAMEAMQKHLAEVQTTLETRRSQLAEKEAEVAEVQKAHEEAAMKCEMLRFWERAFGSKGIKAFIIEGMLPTLNRLLKEHLLALTDGQIKALVSATTALKKGGTAERMAVEIDNANGADLYAGNSGGERRRIDLAILLGLQDLVGQRASRAVDLCIYDEILDQLDEDGRMRAIEHLKIRAVKRPTYLISHSETTRALTDEAIEVA